MPAAPTSVYGDDSLASLFLKTATAHPDGLALVSSRGNLTYRDLLSRAVCLALVLRQNGATRGTLVGIWLSRSVESVVAVLGTLLCGAAYVPIDPTYPTQRQQFLIDDSQLSLVVTSRQVGMPAIALGSATVVDIDTITSQTLTTDQLTTFEPTPTTADDLIYVLYTSGSTGRPKGVVVGQGSLLNYVVWARGAYGGGLTFPFFTSLAFDLTLTSPGCPARGASVMTVQARSMPSPVVANGTSGGRPV